MKVSYAVSFLAFGLIVAFAVYYIGALGVSAGPPDDRVNVAMQVPDINGLVVDSNVLLRGVPIGKVTGIDTSLTAATVHFYIEKQYPIPVDSDVRLENLSALGESYIGLVPRTPNGPMFHDGQQVATENVTQPASISELATSVVRVLNQMDPGQLNRLVDETDRALPPTKEVLPNLTRAGTLLRDTANGMQGRGSDMLSGVQTLLAEGAYIGPALSEISPPLLATGPPFKGLGDGAYRLAVNTGAPQSLKNFGALIDRVQKFLDNSAPDLKVYAQAFHAQHPADRLGADERRRRPDPDQRPRRHPRGRNDHPSRHDPGPPPPVGSTTSTAPSFNEYERTMIQNEWSASHGRGSRGVEFGR